MDTNLPVSQLDPLGNQHFTGVGDAFKPWLGPMPTLQRSDPYEKRNASVWDMPENFKGKNETLAQTIDELVFTAGQTYLTKYIMTFYPTDNVNIQWEKFEANAHLLDNTPYQTTSHAVSQKRSIRRAQLVRKGIMAEFEMDFLRTAMGRVSYLAAIRQVSNSVLETINADIITALGAGHRYQQQFLRETQIPAEQLFKRYLEDDRDRFAIVQKTKNGLEKLDLLINKEMQQYRGVADALLVPEEIAIFATIVRDEKTDFDKAGPEGPNRVNGLPGLSAKANQGNLIRVEPMHMVRNTPVFIVSNLMVENVTEAESQQLTRTRQIGEYVKLIDETTDYSEYRTIHRSILMYNEEIDNMTKITIQDCIENCGLWESDGSLRRAGYDNSSVMSRNDLDDDFLTFLSPVGNQTRRLPVEYLFDISKEYLSTRKVVAAGETLLNSYRRKTGGFGLPVADANGVFDLSVYNDTLTNLVNIVGNDMFNLFTVDNLSQILGGLNLAPVVLNNGEDAPEGQGPTFIKSKVDDAFQKLLLSQVPASKKAEGEAIIRGPGDTLAKAAQIRDKLISYIGENIPGYKYKDEAPLHALHNRNVKEYTEQLAKVGATSGRSGGSTSGIVGYMKRGRNLSGTGYRYLYPESAQPVRDSIDALLPVHIMRSQQAGAAASAEPSSSRMQPGGEGLGLAGIGQFYQDTFSSRREANTGFDYNRLRTLQVHLDGLTQSSASDEVKFMARAWLLTRVNKDNIMRLAEYDVLVPMNFLILRPHMQYRTRAIIKCKQNGGTGNLFIGNSSCNIGFETNRKMVQLHYTTHFRAVVTEPRNLYVQPDVYVQEYNGGSGCRFYDIESYSQQDNDHLENSLICVACPITETIFPNCLDISGRFYTDFGAGTIPRAAFEKLHYSTAARYNILYNFMRSNKNGMDVPSMGPGRNHVNRICWAAHQQSMNPKTGEYSNVITGRGHWFGSATYPGCAPVRNGALEQFKENPQYVFGH